LYLCSFLSPERKVGLNGEGGKESRVLSGARAYSRSISQK
jgi:hypothetical protein